MRWLLHRRASCRPGLLTHPGGQEGSRMKSRHPAHPALRWYLVRRSRTCCLRLGMVASASTMVQAACRAACVAGVKSTCRGWGEVPGSADSLSSGPARHSQLPRIQGKSSEHLTSKRVKEKPPANSRSGCCRRAKRLSKSPISMVLFSQQVLWRIYSDDRTRKKDRQVFFLAKTSMSLF